MAPPGKSRVLIVDADPVSRVGLVRLLNGHVRLRVVAEAGTLSQARESCRHCQPDLVVFDMDLSDDGEFIREVTQLLPQVRVVAFTARTDIMSMRWAILSGAGGSFTLDDSLPAIIRVVLETLDREPDGPRAQGEKKPLSDREWQIFRLRLEGRSVREIAAESHLSVKVVEFYLQRAITKLELVGREEPRRALMISNPLARHCPDDAHDYPCGDHELHESGNSRTVQEARYVVEKRYRR